MESSPIQIKTELEDLPEDNPDLVNVEEIKCFKQDDPTNSFYSTGVKPEVKNEIKDNCTTLENQLDTSDCDSENEDSLYFKTNKKGQLKRKVKCEQCGALCCNKSAYKLHLMYHTGDRPFKCELCDKSYKQSRDFIYHMSSHTGSYEHYCEVCGKGFTVQSVLRTHMRSHTKDKPFVCPICGRAFSHSSSLRAHSAVHSDEHPFQCERCQVKFKTKGAWTRHLREHERKEQLQKHTNEGGLKEETYPCTQCGNTYKNLHSLKCHMQYHTDDVLKCHFCEKSYVKRNRLQIHLRTHTGERPFECKICNQKFISQTGLNTHSKIHDSNRQTYNCDMCGKVLASKSTLRIHLSLVHSTNQFQCELCQQSFKLRYNLKKHLRKHHSESTEASQEMDNKEQKQEKPLKCHICTKSFMKEYNLHVHLKQHDEDQADLKCEVCDVIFKRKRYLQRHMTIHQSDRKTYNCDTCDKVFQSKSSMRGHWKNIHSTEKMNQCKFCGEKFQAYHQLRSHLRSHNGGEESGEDHSMESNGAAPPTETDSSESVCPICQADCSAEGLEVHMLNHEVKPFKCECSGVFFSEIEYKEHLKDDCEFVKGGLELVENVKCENEVKEELEISSEGIKVEYDS